MNPAQNAIRNWTEQRDSLLREIGVASGNLERVRRECAEAAAALTDLQVSIGESRGRLAELAALEERQKTSVSIEVAELVARKSRLESECAEQAAKLDAACGRYAMVASVTEELEAAHAVMKDQATIVNSVVGQIIETSKLHLSDARVTMGKIRSIAAEVIEKANENVRQTNIVLPKMARFVFALQKPIPVRRTYRVPRGMVVAPGADELSHAGDLTTKE